MIRNIIFQVYIFLSYLMGYGQSAEILREEFLPKILSETSGLLFYPPDKLMQINDSGNPPEILVTDTLGNLLQQYCLPGAINIDWEDLARDTKGNLYIGDFGNNLNRRKDLVIYKVDEEKILKGDDSFNLHEIHFTYEDQKGFPPERNKRHFDMEAMIHIGDSLYLFSKNRTSPFNGYIYCYRLPDSPGSFVAEKIDSFQTGQGLKESYWITAADYKAKPPTLLLLGYDKLWMFYGFTGTRFFEGNHNILYFNSFSQKEGVSFYRNSKIFITDEKIRKSDGKIYTVRLPEIIKGEEILHDSLANTYHIQIPEIFDDELSIQYICDSCNIRWEVINSLGQRIFYGTIHAEKTGQQSSVINAKEWPNGEYLVNIYIDKKVWRFDTKKVKAD